MTAIAHSAELGDRLLDEAGLSRILARLAHEVAERHPRLDTVVLVGIPTRGVPLAQRVARLLAEIQGHAPTVATIDIRDYRDDRPRPQTPRSVALTGGDGGVAPQIDGSEVVVVDDVFCTGRTLRAALDALSGEGRPASVELLVLVDRGHRELPLRATYVGRNVPTSPTQRVRVRLRECDGVDGAWLVTAS